MRQRTAFFLAALLTCPWLLAQETDQNSHDLTAKLHHDLVKMKYADLQTLHDEDLALLKKDPGDPSLHDYYEALSATGNIPLLKKWSKRDGGSYVPWVVLGRALIKKGWEYRGHAVAAKVPDSAWKPFKACLEESKTYLDKVETMGVDDPYPYNYLMIIGRAQCRAKYVMKKYFEESLGACPGNYDAKVMMAYYLSPMWCGSVEKMADFVKQYALKAPKGSPDRLLIVHFHDEKQKVIKEPDYKKNKQIWGEVYGIFEDFLAAHPERMDVRSWYAYWCLFSAHSVLANKEFNILGENWDANPDFWLTQKNYDFYKKRAADYVAAHPPRTPTPTKK